MRKILSLFFVTVLSVCALFALSFTSYADDSATTLSENETTPTDSGYCGDNVTWAYYEETGLLEINGSGDMDNYRTQTVYDPLRKPAPWDRHKYSIREIVISDQITSIGDNSFINCTSLASISLGRSITRIGLSAFYGCTSLERVHIKDVASWCNVVCIGVDANPLYYAGNLYVNDELLTELVIPKEVTSIGAASFSGCTSITKLKMSDSVESIGVNAFSDCTNLTSVEISKGITNIGNSAFNNCTALESINLPEGLNNIGEYAFSGCCTQQKSLTIPSSVDSIGAHAFSGWNSLEEISLPFTGETKNALGTVSHLGYVFGYRYGNHSNLGTVVYYDKEFITYTIPLSLKHVTVTGDTIGDIAFYGCKSLTRVIVEDSVTSIGASAFKACGNLVINGYYNTSAYTYAIENGVAFEALPCKKCIYNQETIQDDYLKSNATCEESVAYYKHCLCGNISSTDFFYYGEPHNYVDKVNEIYIKEAATCTSVAIYYKSCRDCGIAHTTKTFEGEFVLPHEYIDFLDKEYLKSDATIYSPAIYYKSCKSCGLKSNDTFDHGEPLETYQVVYNANDGQGSPSTQTKTEGIELTLSNEIPTMDGYKFIGWNTLTHGETIYSPGDNYTHNENITLYAMWLPDCSECNGAGGFTQGEQCAECWGTGYRYEEERKCNACGSSKVYYEIISGLGESLRCEDCKSKDCSSKQVKYTCYACSGGIVNKTYECEDCDGLGYNLPLPPTVLSYSDTKVTLLQLSGFEYSLDGVNWQSSNIFTGLSPATVYTFYQRVASTDSVPFGCTSAGVEIKTDKAENTNTPSAPTVNSITSNTVTLNAVTGCEYSKDGINWQASSVFSGLSIVTEYTFYMRYAETETAYASSKSEGLAVKTDKGIPSTPSAPTVLEKMYNKVILVAQDGYEYSRDGVHWQKSNIFTDLDSNTNYVFFCRKAENDSYYASAASSSLTVKTERELETKTTYTVIFKNYDGSIISQAEYEKYDTVIIPDNPTIQTDMLASYEFIGWDAIVDEICFGEVTYTAEYSLTYFNYTVIFKNEDGSVLSTETYHYGDEVTIPTTPAKDADNTYTYIFKAWDNEVINCAGDATYTATYDSHFIDYTIIFKNEDGTVLCTNTYHYGDAVTFPTTPTKDADNTYTYTFKSWDAEVVDCAGDTTYTATYDSHFIDYTVIFKNEDGTVLCTNTYHYGDAVTIPTTPTKDADSTYIYTFKSWDSEVVDCAGNTTYIATYDSHFIDYTVIFKNEDGTVLSTKTYHYGDEITVPATPTKDADNTYTYTFKSWDAEVVDCVGNAIYTATYDSHFIDYTIIFKNEDGTVLSTNTYHYGDEVTIPTTPAKDADNTYTYTFKAWDNEVINCAGDATYIATYDSTYIDYTVIFNNEDGTVLSTETYHYGDQVAVPATPAKDADSTYTYTFKSWDAEVVDCAGNATYTATYDSHFIDYTVIFKNADGTVLSTETYHYGDEVTVPATPNKAADNTYTYTFKAWDNEVINCAGDATYIATYDSIYIDYIVIFKNENGTVLSSNTYHYGDKVTAPSNPTKESDNEYTYTFNGWDKEIVACDGDATYIATYTATEIEDTTTPGADTEPDTNPDTDVNTPSDNDTNDENDGLSGGAVAGIAVGSTVAAGAGGFSLFWFVIKKKKFADIIKIFKK